MHIARSHGGDENRGRLVAYADLLNARSDLARVTAERDAAVDNAVRLRRERDAALADVKRCFMFTLGKGDVAATDNGDLVGVHRNVTALLAERDALRAKVEAMADLLREARGVIERNTSIHGATDADLDGNPLLPRIDEALRKVGG